MAVAQQPCLLSISTLSYHDDQVSLTLVAGFPNTKELLTASKCMLLLQSGLSRNAITHANLITPSLLVLRQVQPYMEDEGAINLRKGALHWLALSLQLSRCSCNTVSLDRQSCLLIGRKRSAVPCSHHVCFGRNKSIGGSTFDT